MKTTRRSFLKSAVLTAAPLIIPSSVLSAAPSERITMGFVGMGKQNRGLLGNFLGRTQVLAVCDVDTTRRENARKRVDDFYTKSPDKGSAGCKAYVDYAEMIARKDIDTICIATPDHWHSEVTIAALKSGKDVYCEKPLTHNISEAVAVMNTTAANNRILQTGSMQRSSKEFRVACELAQNGLIGKISHIECSFGDPGRPCDLPGEDMEPGLDWNMWLGPAPKRPYNSILSPRGIHDHFPDWRNYREFGGGMVTDWGAHHLDIAQWALAMDESGPVEVLPPEDPKAKRGATLVYANGVKVIHKDGFGVHMYGSEGEIMVNRGKFWFIQNGKTIAKFTQREDGGSLDTAVLLTARDYLKDAKIKLVDTRGDHTGDFLNSVKSRQKPITHEGVGGHTAICCHLMNQSYYNHARIKWDPAKFTFIGGTGDPSWLTRNYRDYRHDKV